MKAFWTIVALLVFGSSGNGRAENRNRRIQTRRQDIQRLRRLRRQWRDASRRLARAGVVGLEWTM